MNQLVKRSLILSRVVFRPRPLTLARLSSDQKPPTDEQKIKETIETNEDQYFHKVKSSFERLQKSRENEEVEEKRSRLIYQSRKRGISENGLILANFSAEFLPQMSPKQLDEYDKIINGLHNEWDLYYWLTEAVPAPGEFASMEVLGLMKKFCLNDNNQSRIVQPDLNFKK